MVPAGISLTNGVVTITGSIKNDIAKVEITTNGSTYSWSFSVSNSPRAPAATGITR